MPIIPNSLPIESALIKEIGYDSEEKDLYIYFHKGGLFKYSGVENAIWDEFVAATSKGKYFHSVIKPRYSEYKRIES
jgi:hypothetical protein